jgi:hypothetical protein
VFEVVQVAAVVVVVVCQKNFLFSNTQLQQQQQ